MIKKLFYYLGITESPDEELHLLRLAKEAAMGTIAMLTFAAFIYLFMLANF